MTSIIAESATSPFSPSHRSPVNSRRVAAARQRVVNWFLERAWTPFRFQRQAWNAYLDGKSGLIHASTGMGKTYAAWMGPVIEALAEQPVVAPEGRATRVTRKSRPAAAASLRVLWLTPLRALAADTVGALEAPLRDLGVPWTVETRTSDTSAAVRNRQRTRLPSVLITTPESLSLILSQPDGRRRFADLRLIVVDEWHELLATKRGVQTELACSRLRSWRPQVQTWGVSATLGNVDEAMEILVGSPRASARAAAIPGGELVNGGPDRRTEAIFQDGVLIRGNRIKHVVVDSLIPELVERFPWAGHMGLRLAGHVVEQLRAVKTSLVFTNTRAQAEMWYQEVLRRCPQWADEVALHHGSLDRATRHRVEEDLREGRLKCVICTSTLDLGVDFSPVERVFQVGSPKGIARLLQRAGRSGHNPDRASRVTCVPTHALELLEVAAARDAIGSGFLEARVPPSRPIDVLMQHVVTIAAGDGFRSDELLDEVRRTRTYQSLPKSDWDWVLNFVTTGGDALRAYPDYRKVQIHGGGDFKIEDARIARLHRMTIGTIVSDASLAVQYLQGPRLGTIDESFLAKIRPGDRFVFAGKVVELFRIQDSTVWVRRAKNATDARIPRWQGGRMPLSTELASAVRNKLDEAAAGQFDGAEMASLRQLLTLQQAWSHLPRHGELLIERVKSREGHHLFFYPFAGRLVHEGLAALLAYRLAKITPITFSMSVNDYGIELLSPTPAPLETGLKQGLFRSEAIAEEIAACMNAAEMGKRQFRELAHIAGLVFPGYPGNRKSARQLQASTGLLYDVFTIYDPRNLLLDQAHREVLERQLEHDRLTQTLAALQQCVIVHCDLARFSPLGFPLLVDRLRERLSSEKLADRVRRMQMQLEKAAGHP